MRSFGDLVILLFLCFYIIISTVSYLGLKRVFITQKALFLKLVIFFEILFISFFVLFYVYPFSPSSSFNFHFYTFINAFLFLNILYKLPLSGVFFIQLFYKNAIIKRRVIICGKIISVLLITSLLIGTFLGSKQINTLTVKIESTDIPVEFDGYRIVQISDIHLGSFSKNSLLLKNVLKEIKSISPNLVVFTGDLVNNFAEEISDYHILLFQKYLSELNCFSILGNHDYGNYSKWKSLKSKENNFEIISESHKKMGFTLLRNENVKIKLNNDSIFLIGVENWGHAPFPQYANLNEAIREIPENSYKILLSHDPAHWQSVVKNTTNINLTLSGHTHGLQWGIKLSGIPFSLSYLTRKYWGGLYRFDNQILYVNTGIGVIGIPWRIDMPAEITVLELKRVKID